MSESTILVIGGCAVDEGYRATSSSTLAPKMISTSTPCKFLFRSAGGVGRNLADVLRHLLPVSDFNIELMSAVGADVDGTFLLNHCAASKIGVRNTISLKTATTAK